MAIGYRDGIAILQLITFIPCFNLSIWLCVKQGLKAVASCWRFLLILAALRISGAVCQLIMISHPTEEVIVTKLTCDLLGIAPLTLACVGLMQRVNESVKKIPRHVFIFISLISLAGLGVGTAGAIKSVEATGLNVSSMLQAALALFIACLGIMLVMLVYLTRFMKQLPRSEQLVLYAMYACSPFLVVRMVYASMGDFGSDSRFSLFHGDDTIYLCMCVLMEIILMAICITVGFYCTPPTLEKSDNADTSTPRSSDSERKTESV